MADLTTLAHVKEWLGITDTSQDAMLSRLISSASQDFLNEINRPDLVPETEYTEHLFRPQDFACNPRNVYYWNRGYQQIFLKHYPVNSVTTLTSNGEALTLVSDPGDPQSGSGYWFDDTLEPENRQSVFLLADLGVWYPGGWPAFLPDIVITYEAGYDDVPPAIEQAVIELVAFKRGESQLQSATQTGGAVTIGTYSEQGGSIEMTLAALEASLPVSVQRVVDQYRRAVI
jgi:hypothetical protein